MGFHSLTVNVYPKDEGLSTKFNVEKSRFGTSKIMEIIDVSFSDVLINESEMHLRLETFLHALNFLVIEEFWLQRFHKCCDMQDKKHPGAQ